ncbi:MAG: hypothetical protein D6702_06985 [Planctomycetota bacterium]|nr:MAG: hypothetical protein D6702_06985 [Planctomycetota bacterium]
MSGEGPGRIRIEGLLEGPTASFSPAADRLAEALVRAGAPADCLVCRLEGGRAAIEPAPGLFPREQFAADPAEALALALTLLLEEEGAGAPSEWFSTLRVTAWEEDRRRESLLQLSRDGIRVVARESPWSPPPPERRSLLRRYGLIALLLAVGGGAWLFQHRQEVRDLWRAVRAWWAGD